MRVQTLKFGEIDVPEEATLDFPEGILGFPDFRRCCLLPHGSTPGLRWLQCLHDPGLVFLAIEPHLIFADYEVAVSDADCVTLGLTDPNQACVLTLITVSQDGTAVATNLLAPIVINIETRQGRQIILETDRYLTKHLIGSRMKEELNAGIDAENQ